MQRCFKPPPRKFVNLLFLTNWIENRLQVKTIFEFSKINLNKFGVINSFFNFF